MAGPDFQFEDECTGPVAGVDEAGRGPWAGPVVAAAVILDRRAVPVGLNDSKKLSARRREALFDEIFETSRVGVGIGTVAEIEAFNILGANDLAMRRAIAEVGPAKVLIDGNRIPKDLDVDAISLVKGDGRSLSIAAASIIAKVTRDRIMAKLALECPGYGWERNNGYGTAEHRSALEKLGVTRHHRRSFRPIHNILCEESLLKI
ncbi:ribonuclease HII [Rhodobacteraceae bacterium NNCM2]|nr:ribonuclease HII [Coraliihabitans acroporae]